MSTTYNRTTNGTGALGHIRDVRPLRSVHQVVPGDTLGDIAHRYGLEPQTLIQLNSHTIGSGGVIHPGMRLQV